MTDDAAVRGLFAEVEQRRGLCSLLISSAGVMKVGAAEALSAEDLRASLEANVVGPAVCAREAFKHMMRRGDGAGGRIINVGSLAAFSPRPCSAPYTTSKFALRGLTESLALDGRAHNIGVGAVHPGNVISDLLTAEQLAARKESEGFITPNDVARTVLVMWPSSPHRRMCSSSRCCLRGSRSAAAAEASREISTIFPSLGRT